MLDILPLVMGTGALALVITLAFKRWRLPPLIGYILAGVLMTAIADLHYDESPVLHDMAEMGIVLLMFTIGLEFSLRELKAMWRAVFLNGGLQVLGAGGLMAAIGHWGFGLDEKRAILVAAALSLSSTAIVLKHLNETGDIAKPFGRHCLGILLFQDLAVIPILLMVQIFSSHSASLGVLLLEAVISAVIVFVVIFVVGKYGVDRLLGLVSDAPGEELFLGAVLMLVISAALFTHHMGFSFSLGAFLAGLMLAKTQYKHQVEADLAPFRDLLMAVFFVAVGMQIELDFVAAHWPLIAATLGGLMLLKGVVTFLVIRISDSPGTALKSAFTLAQGGGFTFAVLEASHANGLLEPYLHQLLVAAAVFSMFLTPFILRHLNRLVAWLEPEPDPEEARQTVRREGERLLICGADGCQVREIGENHVIVCGYDALGQSVVAQLRALGIPYLALEHQRKLVEAGAARGDVVIYGNAADRTILDTVQVRRASAVIIAMGDESKIRLVSEAVSRLASNPVIVAKAADEARARLLLDHLPVRGVVCENREVARLLIDHALTCEDLAPYLPQVCRQRCQPASRRPVERILWRDGPELGPGWSSIAGPGKDPGSGPGEGMEGGPGDNQNGFAGGPGGNGKGAGENGRRGPPD